MRKRGNGKTLQRFLGGRFQVEFEQKLGNNWEHLKAVGERVRVDDLISQRGRDEQCRHQERDGLSQAGFSKNW